MSDDLINIDEITPKSKNINIVFRVLEMEEIRNVRSKKDRTPHAVTEALIGDGTGVVLITIWDEMLEKIDVGKTYHLTNGYSSLFRGKIRINIGKYVEVEEVEDPGFEINRDNNISDKVHNDPRRSKPNEWFGTGSFWPGR